ncbi:MAG: YidC/Oxa1 family membrane protein insertase [Candidatus Veblenbacteria bacterium]|nr:YidC/Oxa1 family membrane protein insertase [Candidatus Veblenbacteria bacterium]
MAWLWQTIFYQPLLNLLVWIYNLVGGDMGLAIIGLTVVIKLVLYPFSQQSLKSQRALQRLQPQVEELKKRLKGQKDKLAQELMQLYQRERVSPLSSCLPLLVQLPFLIALFQVFRNGLNSGSLDLLYSWVVNPGHLNDTLFGMWHLAGRSLPLAVVTGVVQWWQTKMLVAKKPPVAVPGSQDENLTSIMNKQMQYMLPAMTVVFGFTLPGGLMLYWLVNTLLTIGQQYLTFKRHD